MFRFIFIIIIFFSHVAVSSADIVKKDYNLLNNKLTVVIDSGNPPDEVFKKIAKTLNYIESILDPSNSDSFVNKFNNLEKNSEILAPDLFVDAFRIMLDYNKITKKSFDPTTFSLLSTVSSLEGVSSRLKSDLFIKCMDINNIEVKITNVFSKKYACTKVSFDSIIDGIVVQNIKHSLEILQINSYSIKFGNTFYSRNFNKLSNEFDLETKGALDAARVRLKVLDSYSFLVNSNNKIKTYNINLKKNQISLNNDFFVIVASNSPVNNSILANSLNLVDYSIFAEDLYSKKIPLIIVYKDSGKYIVRYSKSFEPFFDNRTRD